jgi:hypothetical protein
VSIKEKSEGVFEVGWRKGARQKSLRVHGSHELARKIERKQMSIRDENRHLDVKREVNLRIHDKRRRSLRTGEDLGPLEYKNDRALREAGAATYIP